jgi:uncharacterized protein YlzI (FlbEa/FlbD family)
VIPDIVLAAFLMVHTVDGREAAVNPKQISSIQRGQDSGANRVLVNKVRCVIGMTNGKFISVLEECDEVLRRLKEGTKP